MKQVMLRVSSYLTVVTLFVSIAISALASNESIPVPKEIQDRVSPLFKVLADVENRFNPVDYVERSAAPFWLEHYEIPLRLAQSTFRDSDSSLIKSALVFTKNGEPWVRWIPNNLDTMYKTKVVDFMKDHGIDATPQKRFVGYATASRSILVFDPVTGAEFSVKSPTNATPGLWKDKPEPVRVGKAVSLVSDYASRMYDQADVNQKINSEIINEPGAILIDGVDQAMVVREYPRAKNKLMIPFFAFFHNEYGKRLAIANGFENAVEFNKEKVLKIWVQALVQHYLLTGLVSNSSHGQNYLVEVDNKFRLTGRVFHRDFADADLNRKIVSSNGGAEVLKIYETFSNNKIREQLSISLQPFKSVMPSELLPWASRLRTLSMSMGRDLGEEFKRHLGSQFSLDGGAHGEFFLRTEPKATYYDGSISFPVNISDEGYRTLHNRQILQANQCSRVFSF